MVFNAFVGRCLTMLVQLATEMAVMILGGEADLKRLQEKLVMIKDVLSAA